MIVIEEKPSASISGVTSLFISFSFKPEIVNVIKSLAKYKYYKDAYTWEVPVSDLATLLDQLTYIDDITLKLWDDRAPKEHLTPALIDQYKLKPFKHQFEAIEYGLQPDHCNWLLLDQPGAGKSSVIIHLAEELRHQKNIQHCLIICGINSLKPN